MLLGEHSVIVSPAVIPFAGMTDEEKREEKQYCAHAVSYPKTKEGNLLSVLIFP